MSNEELPEVFQKAAEPFLTVETSGQLEGPLTMEIDFHRGPFETNGRRYDTLTLVAYSDGGSGQTVLCDDDIKEPVLWDLGKNKFGPPSLGHKIDTGLVPAVRYHGGTPEELMFGINTMETLVTEMYATQVAGRQETLRHDTPTLP